MDIQEFAKIQAQAQSKDCMKEAVTSASGGFTEMRPVTLRDEAEKSAAYHSEQANEQFRVVKFLRDNPASDEFVRLVRSGVIQLLALIAVLGFACIPAHAQVAGTETVTLTDSSCTTATPCTAQIYRATGACPTSGSLPSGATELVSAFAATTTTASSSTWAYPDTTAVTGATYCYYATATFTTGGGPSQPSSLFPVTTPVTQPPAAPGFVSGTFTQS